MMDSPERRERLSRSVERLLHMIDVGAPDELQARECVNIFRHGLSCFEQTTGAIFTNWLIRSVRVNTNQCYSCGGDLHGQVAGPPTCSGCRTNAEVDILKQSLAEGEFEPDNGD